MRLNPVRPASLCRGRNFRGTSLAVLFGLGLTLGVTPVSRGAGVRLAAADQVPPEPAPLAGPDADHAVAPAPAPGGAAAGPAEAEGQPALAPVAADGYLPFCELRVEHVDAALKSLHTFLDAAVPVAAATAEAHLIPRLVFAAKLTGVDTAKPVRIVVFMPKPLFALAPERLKAEAADGRLKPVLAQLVPLANEKDFLAELGDDIDDLKADGEYQTFTNQNNREAVYLKCGSGFAVFSNDKKNVDVGLLYAKQLAALPPVPPPPPPPALADAPVAPVAPILEPAIVWELHPRELLKQTGLDGAEQRKRFEAAMEIAFEFLRDRKTNVNAPGIRAELRYTSDPADLVHLLDGVLTAAPQIERIQAGLRFDKEHADGFVKMDAVDGSELAQVVAGLKPADLKQFNGLKGVSPVWALAGQLDPALVTLLAKWAPAALPQEPEGKAIFALVTDLLGQPHRQVFGFAADQAVAGAAVYGLPKESDAVSGEKKLLASLIEKLKQTPMPGRFKWSVAEPTEADGWSVQAFSLEEEDRPGQAPEVTPARVLFGKTLAVVVLTRGRDVLLGEGDTAEQALANAREYFDHPAALPYAEASAGLTRSTGERNGVLVGCFSPAPLFMKDIKLWLADDGLMKTADETIAKTDPLALQLFAKAGTLELQFRLQAETVRQYVTFMNQVRAFFMGGGAPKPGNQTPPGGKDDQF